MIEIHEILSQESELDGYVSFRSFVRYLVDIMEDTTDKDQVREAFEGVSSHKPFVTELDLKLASLNGTSMDSLKHQLPILQEDQEEGLIYDFNSFIDQTFI